MKPNMRTVCVVLSQELCYERLSLLSGSDLIIIHISNLTHRHQESKILNKEYGISPFMHIRAALLPGGSEFVSIGTFGLNP